MKIENKMTALEWLIEQLKDRAIDLNKWNCDLIEKAKEIEKQQLNDAYNADRPNLNIRNED